MYNKIYDAVEFKGKVFTSIEIDEDNNRITFITNSGKKYLMYHEQDCCEDVYIHSILGDIKNILNSEILESIEYRSSTDWQEDLPGGLPEYKDDSFTWSVFNLKTENGGVLIRWFGTSNGYYSESVDIVDIE